MALEVGIPTDKKINVAVSGGFDSAVLWYSVYKTCLERGQECVAITAPQNDSCVGLANSVLTYIHSVLGGTVNETIVLGPTGYDEDEEDSSFVVGRMLDVINEDIETYGDEVFMAGSQTYDPSGNLDEYKQYRFGTTDIEQLLIDTRPNINFQMPFRYTTKVNIIEHMQELDSDVCNQLLILTSSCWNPVVESDTIERCGTCASCVERAWACEETGITDPGTK